MSDSESSYISFYSVSSSAEFLEIMKVSLGCTSVSVSPVVRKSKENLALPVSR